MECCWWDVNWYFHYGGDCVSSIKNYKYVGNSLVVQWLGLCAFTAEGLGSIPGRGAEISQAVWCGQKKKNYKCMIPFLRLHPVASGRHRRGRTQESAHCNLPAMGNCNQQGAPPRPGLPGVDASPTRQEGACPRLGCESTQTSELQDSA